MTHHLAFHNVLVGAERALEPLRKLRSLLRDDLIFKNQSQRQSREERGCGEIRPVSDNYSHPDTILIEERPIRMKGRSRMERHEAPAASTRYARHEEDLAPTPLWQRNRAYNSPALSLPFDPW